MVMKNKVFDLRQEYSKAVLLERSCEKSPIDQFQLWMDEALKAEIPEPHAMNIASVNASGRPSSRMVLLRNFDENGFVFFTNYTSKKSQDLLKNPYACFNFFWQAIERQIRIEGRMEKLNENDSDEYFASRPRESQIGAWASNQSKRIVSRQELEDQFIYYQNYFENKNVERPPHWGGFRLVPDYFEFWQGRPSRLHDRLAYQKNEAIWEIIRLNP
jgi:pyridoxamine 5'-phosphate oxidase